MRNRFFHHVRAERGFIVPGVEGFVHCSFADAVEETVRVHLGGRRDVWVHTIDPRRVGARVEIARTPRGPMPHVWGPIPEDATTSVTRLDEPRPDRVTGTRFGFVVFRGMTLLDLVGAHDPISRIAKMGFDESSTCSFVAAHEGPVWSEDGARFEAERVRPPLADFDVLVVPGGRGTRELEGDREVIDWLATFPKNRLATSVCTGALLLGAAGRLANKRATTHASELERLPRYGAVIARERVVDDAELITAGGVTSAIDLGLHLVRELAGEPALRAIAKQMEWPDPR